MMMSQILGGVTSRLHLPSSRPVEADATRAVPADSVAVSAEAPAAPSGEMASFQKNKRLATNLTLLAAGDIPAMITIGANFGWLPLPSAVLMPLNAFNAMTGALGIASDVSVVRDCVTNPDVPLKDKIVDLAHLGNDFLNTGASMVPLFMTMGGPLSAAGLVFMGGQVIGTMGDFAKLMWDHHRGFGQSAHADGDQSHRLVMDRFEQRMGQLPMAAAYVGAQSLVGVGLALPAALAATMASFGGAFAAVYGYTQVKKSQQFKQQLEGLKAGGVESIEMPKWTRKGLVHESMDVDKAISTVNRRKWTGIAQVAASTVLIAAGCIASPAMVMGGLGACTAFGLAAAGAELHANRHEIAEKFRGAAARLLGPKEDAEA